MSGDYIGEAPPLPQRMFPILRAMKNDGVAWVIPWEVLAPHEPQAIMNHNQTLQRLAERGGLSAGEAVAILEDRAWRPMTEGDARHRLSELTTVTQIIPSGYTPCS